MNMSISTLGGRVRMPTPRITQSARGPIEHTDEGSGRVLVTLHGGMGGARSVEQLRQVTAAMEMAPLSNALHLQGAAKLREGDRFNAGEIEDRRLSALFDELLWWGRALKAARQGD